MSDLKFANGFDTEAKLVLAILSYLRGNANRAFRVELELDAGVGFADVVLYRRFPRTTRQIQILAAIPPRLAPLLDPAVSDKIRSTKDLAESLGLSMSAAERVMRHLRQLGLFRSRFSGEEGLESIKVPPFETIISLEAKLNDWSRALVQAYRNLQFADESWVVLDHRFCNPAISQLQRFQRSGVGLASVDTIGNLYIHHEATTATPISTTKRWHAQAALARRVATRSDAFTSAR